MIMGYRVIRFFYDLTDSAHPYNVGDSFPREGLAVSDKRIAELTTDKNRLKAPVIEVIAEKKARRRKEE